MEPPPLASQDSDDRAGGQGLGGSPSGAVEAPAATAVPWQHGHARGIKKYK